MKGEEKMRKWLPLLLTLIILLIAVSCSPSKLPPLEGEPADLAEEFVGAMVKGDYEKCVDYFSAKMKKAMSARKLEQVWRDLQDQVGEYTAVAGMREEIIDGYDVVFVTVEFEKDSLAIRVVFDKDRRVAGLWFDPAE